jgi:hypothetical protein
MRVEAYGVGSFLHVVRRGARGLPIVKDDWDRHRFLLNLTHFNDAQTSPTWFQDLGRENKEHTFERASLWPDKREIVQLISFCLSNNHLHLMPKEICEGGVSLFMKKLGNGMVGHFQERYKEKGSIFQSSFKSRTINSDEDLRYVIAYIEVKNVFELHPSGYDFASQHFEEAFSWAQDYPFSSLYDRFHGLHERGIVSDGPTTWDKDEYKEFARDVILGRAHLALRASKVFSGHFE